MYVLVTTWIKVTVAPEESPKITLISVKPPPPPLLDKNNEQWRNYGGKGCKEEGKALHTKR